MPWKLGGNYEGVRMTCETGWEECATAVANYLWFEIVSDVVDFLTKEGVTWALAITIVISTMIICTKSRKSARADNTVADKRLLSKIGYKIQDLELKVNVLTYKVQYGTWPLPHQIYSLNPRKLQKIRMTLSNPVDRNSWVKHVTLSPARSDTAPPRSHVHDPSVAKLSDPLDTRRKHVAPHHHTQRGKLSTDCSSIETSKSTSDQSVKYKNWDVYSRRPSSRPRNVSAEGLGDFTLHRNNVAQFLPSVDESSRRSSRLASTSRAKLNRCQNFTDIVRRCSSYLKELGCNDERPSRCSSEGKVSPSKVSRYAAEQPTSLTVEKRKAPDEEEKEAAGEAKRRKDTTGMEDDETTEDIDEAHRDTNVSSSDASKVNDVAFPRQLLRDLLMKQPTRKPMRPSRKTLHEVRRRLQSLHNVLRTYEDTSRSSQKRNPSDRLGEIHAFAPKIEEVDESKIDNQGSGLREASPGIPSIMDSCEFDQTEGSSSSLAGCSSNTVTSAKTYRYPSDVALWKIRAKEQDTSGARSSSACAMSGLANGREQFPPLGGVAMLRASEYQKGRNIREPDVSDHNRELESRENATRASVSFRFGKGTSIFSSVHESEEKYSAKSSTRETTATERIDDALDGEENRGDATMMSGGSSRSKISMRSDQERKPTALLLKEALLFKQALLTRVATEKRRLIRGNAEEDNVVVDESPTEHVTQVESSGRFPSMAVGIETKESAIDAVRGKLDRRYVRLQMKRRRDLLPRVSRNLSALARCEADEGDAGDEEEFVRETPSEYFSICDFRGSKTQIDNDAPLTLKPSIYDQVISIMIPADVGGPEDVETSRRNAGEDGDDVVGRRLPVMLELEDLILERVRNIRDYMDVFLHSENKAISKVRRALQAPDDRVGHVMLHDESAVPFDGTGRATADSGRVGELENNKDGIVKVRRRVRIGKSADAAMPSELPSDIECSESRALGDSSLAADRPDTKTKESEACDPAECPLSCSLKEDSLNANDGPLNDTKHHEPEVSANVANSWSSRVTHRSTRRLHRTSCRVKAKSDMILLSTTKNSNVSLRPKRSHSSLTHRDTLERICRTLHRSDVKSHDDEDECDAKCESRRSAAASRSFLLPQGISARSYIPILRNRLEAARIRHQTSTRSPTRSPLTMLWRGNSRKESRTTDEEAAKRRWCNVPMNEGLGCADEVACSFAKANAEANGEEIAEEEEEEEADGTRGNNGATNHSGILSDDQSAQRRRIDKERADKRLARDGRSDTMTTKRVENLPLETLTVVSDDTRRNCPTSSFVTSTEHARPATDQLPRRDAESRWLVVMEKEVTVKPSVADTCTSITNMH